MNSRVVKKYLVSFLFLIFIIPVLRATVGPVVSGEPVWDITKRIGNTYDVISSKVCIIQSLLCVLFEPEICVNVTVLDVAVTNVDQVIFQLSLLEEALCSQLDIALQGCTPTVISEPTTITNSGSYCVSESFNGIITVAASDVVIDLNQHVIGGIAINSSLIGVTIKNGTIDATQTEGIAVGQDCSMITLEQVLVRNAIRGVHFNTVDQGFINRCTFTQNTTGIQLEDSAHVTIEQSIASNNLHAGFELLRSSTNCITECKAIGTGLNNTESFNNTVIGFVSDSGQNNIFERCIANGTQALSTTDSNSIVAGFALLGFGVQCNKIIDSESATAIASSAGVTVPYGILLEGTLDQVNTLTGYSYNTNSQTVSWSPDQTVLAVGLATGPDDELRIVSFDSVRNTTTQIASQAIGASVSAVSWAPGATRYLAVGTESALQVYLYESVNNSLALQDMASIAAMINAIDWAHDGRYIAVATDTGSNELRVYSYNSVANSLALSNSVSLAANANTVSWLPNDELVAVGLDTGGAGNELRLYTFDRTTNSLTLVDSVSIGDDVNGVDFSFDGYYLAVGTSAALQVYSFNNATNALTLEATASGASVVDVAWSADGKFIASSGTAVNVYSFNRSDRSLTFIASDGDTPTESRWSPDGAFIASVGAALDELTIFSGIQFPMKNVVTNNTVYCNGHDVSATYTGATGVGISGSSVANMITQNTAYNNPSSSQNLIVGSNYQFVTNVFNPLFGQAPSDLQNISVVSDQPIETPEDLTLLLKQTLAKACLIQSVFESIDSQLEEINSLLDEPTCAGTAINEPPATISTSGYYTLCSGGTGSITIAASDVILDLQGNTLSGIIVNTNLEHITILNGVIDATSDDGILINAGCKNITIENVQIKNALRGIHFDTVDSGIINQCALTQNTTGLLMENTINVQVLHTVAQSNVQAGFDLRSSFTNCFMDCKALSTGLDNDVAFNNTVAGFVSANGFGNIFERCIANATQALSTTDSNSLVAGFALRGTEKCSKIIDSESANAIASSSGVTVAYGILLEGTLDATQSLTGALETGTVNTLSWSADGQYIAIGGNDLTGGTGDEFQIFSFDRVSNSLTAVAGALGTVGIVNTLSWSADGQYIAVGGSSLTGGTGDEFQIFSFDRVSNSLTAVAGALGTAGAVDTLSWSADGQYIAVGGNSLTGGTGDDFQIFSFDSVSNSLTAVAGVAITGVGTVNALSWNADGEYVAVGGSGLTGGTGDQFQIFSFDRSDNSLTAVAGALATGTVHALSWNADGEYVAVGGNVLTGGTGDEFQIFSFDRSSNSLTAVAGAFGSTGIVNALSWSADGQYVAIGGAVLAGNEFQIFSFDRSNNSLTVVTSALPTSGSINALSWSADGQYIAVGGSNLTGNRFQIMSGIQFPMKNAISNNVVYCNGHDVSATYTGATGVGISGSSIANMIIGNTAYNNPPASPNLIVGSNYVFVTNVFNPLFGQAPTALQNISLDGCVPITQPEDIDLLLKQTLQKACDLQSIVEQVTQLTIDLITTITGCSPMPIETAQTISTAGSYCLANDVSSLTINASQVNVDLNGYKVSNGITINSNFSAITIENGVVEGTTDGITVNAGASEITIQNVTVKNAIRGIHFESVDDATIDYVTLSQNTTGLQLDSCTNITVNKSRALNNTQAGFELLNSSTCIVTECKALSTGIDNTNLFGDESNVFGFVANQCYGTIFECCIANATQNLSATSFDTVVAGFALLGTGAQCNKIIECEAANAQSSENGDTVPYGIYVQNIVNQFEEVTSALNGTTADVFAVDWSPDGQYVAVVGNNFTGGLGDEFQVFQFDRMSETLTALTGDIAAASGQSRAMSWSPNGQFIAIGAEITGANRLRVYSFDRINNKLTLVASGAGTTGGILSMEWSPDGKYLVIGGDISLTGNKVQVFSFDPISYTLTSVAGIFSGSANVNQLSWSPDGQYIAAIANDVSPNNFRILLFDRSTNMLTSVAGDQGTAFTSGVSWSSDGDYIALLAAPTTGNTLWIYTFDKASSTLTLQTSLASVGNRRLAWDPSSSYIMVGNSAGAKLMRYNRSTNMLTQIQQFSGNMRFPAWAPDAAFLALGFSTGTNTLSIFSAFQFPSGNVITNNVVYCNSNDEQGVGISGSSIANFITRNKAFNNPFNYVFVTNVFNQLFQQGPTLLQNIGKQANDPILTPDDVIARADRIVLLSQSLVDNLL